MIARQDPDAVIAVFTADHLIRPVDRFQEIIAQGSHWPNGIPKTLVDLRHRADAGRHELRLPGIGRAV